jgi:sterol desaturase/sphingolipid hydroxylase (fatty acid hydroxylase superfamily)
MDVAAKMLELGQLFALTYGVLLGCYFASAHAVLFLSRRHPELKIQQDRAARRHEERRDLRQSLRSIAYISGFFSLGWWANVVLGIGLRLAEPTVLNTAVSFVVSMVLFDTWFYWFHRLIHWKPLYRRVHRWHHLCVTPTVWSNNSDTFLDNCFLQSYWLFVHLLIPIAPMVLFAHKIYDQISGVVGHSGFEHGGRLCQPPSPIIGTTNHDQHHRYFLYNYATHFTFWDRLMGTLHPDHDAELRRNVAGRRESAGSVAKLAP